MHKFTLITLLCCVLMQSAHADGTNDTEKKPFMSNDDYIALLRERAGAERGGRMGGMKADSAPASGTNEVVATGNAPEGYGTVVFWDRKQKCIAFAAYVSAADDLGVAIGNLKQGDEVKVLSAAGLASFSESDGGLISGIIGVLAEAADAIALASGVGEAKPVIDKGAQFAADQFGKPKPEKIRDAFGNDDGGVLRRQEGGVLVCMPQAGGVFYSGNGDHKNRWVQGKDQGVRSDDRQPAHMQNRGAFFPIQGNEGHNTRTARAGGMLRILAWDHKFADNKGAYQVIIQITRGD